DPGAPERGDEGLPRIARVGDRGERSRAGAGQQDDDVDGAAHERVEKRERVGLGLRWNLTQRRRDHRLAAETGDERRLLDRPAAFEREDTQPLKPGRSRLHRPSLYAFDLRPAGD